MFKRIAAVLAAIVLAVGIGATPARADTYHSCVSGSVCLYQWINFSGPNGSAGRWQSSLGNIWYSWDGCLVIWPATWANGTPVSANSAGFVSNPGGQFAGADWKVTFYTSGNCTTGGFSVSLIQETETGQLVPPHYHGIRSIGITLSV
jgi:hypothetical protein